MQPIDSSQADELRPRASGADDPQTESKNPQTASHKLQMSHQGRARRAAHHVRGDAWLHRPDRRLRVTVALLAGMVVCALLMPTSFVMEGAGPALDVNGTVDNKPVVALSGVTTYPSESDIFLTTVSSWGTPNVGITGYEALWALASPNYQLFPVRALYPAGVTANEVDEQNQQQMAASQDSAAAVAFHLAGFSVQETLTVAQVSKDYPSGAVLRVGDVITGIRRVAHAEDETPVANFVELANFLAAVTPGQEVQLQIVRDGVEHEVTTATVAQVGDADGAARPGAMLGVGINVADVRLPGKVTYGLDDIGGPSAGLMFTLGIYDQLTEGSLTGKIPIAGTGTMGWDGKVGVIGGIVHKMRGAAQHGVSDFLAPSGNCVETVGHEPPGMRVWAVSTAEEAIAAAQAIGSGQTDALTPCSALGR